nr:transposase [Roseomonas aerilata]
MLRFLAYYLAPATLPIGQPRTRQPMALVSLASRTPAPVARLFAECVHAVAQGTSSGSLEPCGTALPIYRPVTQGAHAVLVLDGTGWHTSPRLRLPENISLLPPPRYAPELNLVENIWEFLRKNLCSQRVWDSYDAVVDACCHA